MYPNEVARPIVWEPVIIAEAFLVSGAGMLALASIGLLSGRMKRAVPVLLVAGFSFFLVLLLAPLADLWRPERAARIMTAPHIMPAPLHPGVSLIALYGGVFWPIMFLLSLVLMLLYFSYYMHVKSEAGRGVARVFYRILSLGVKDEVRYRSLGPLMKAVAVVVLLLAIVWSLYPAILLRSQTSIFLWSKWDLLPLTGLASTFAAAAAVAVLVYTLATGGRVHEGEASQLLMLNGGAAIALAGLLLLQVAVWNISLGGSDMFQAFSPVIPLMHAVAAIMTLSFILSLASLRWPVAGMAASIATLAGVLVNYWNIIVNGQLAARNGLSVLEPHLPEGWLAATIAPIAAGVVVLIILSYIFPLNVDKIRG